MEKVTISRHIQAMKCKDESGRWFNISIYELLAAIMQATGCDKVEAIENVNWMAEDCFDVHVNGFCYAVQEVL